MKGKGLRCWLIINFNGKSGIHAGPPYNLMVARGMRGNRRLIRKLLKAGGEFFGIQWDKGGLEARRWLTSPSGRCDQNLGEPRQQSRQDKGRYNTYWRADGFDCRFGLVAAGFDHHRLAHSVPPGHGQDDATDRFSLDPTAVPVPTTPCRKCSCARSCSARQSVAESSRACTLHSRVTKHTRTSMFGSTAMKSSSAGAGCSW